MCFSIWDCSLFLWETVFVYLFVPLFSFILSCTLPSLSNSLHSSVAPSQELGLPCVAWVSCYVIILHSTRDSLVQFLEVKLNHLSPRNTFRPQTPVGADIPTIAVCLFPDLEHSRPLSPGLCLRDLYFPLLSGPSFPITFLSPLTSRCLFWCSLSVFYQSLFMEENRCAQAWINSTISTGITYITFYSQGEKKIISGGKYGQTYFLKK